LLAASATRDGCIFLISAASGATKTVLDIAPEIPLLVAVTSGWGFVLVHSRKIDKGLSSFFVSVYTVNGEFIRKRQIGFQIQVWTHWTCSSGFDYVVAASETGQVYVFEAFFLDIENQFAQVRSRIVSMQYFKDRQVLAIVADRQIHLFPASQMRMERFKRTLYGKVGQTQ
jgi:ribulose 1,5-bisphosphate carboxylase large subunit-like protein